MIVREILQYINTSREIQIFENDNLLRTYNSNLEFIDDLSDELLNRELLELKASPITGIIYLNVK